MKLLQTNFSDGLVLNYSSQDLLIGGEVARYGTYEHFETQLLLQTLQPGDVAIDVGANIGVYTLQMARKVSRTGKVYAFEPEPTNFFILSKNISENNFTHVFPLSVGLADHKTQASLYLSWDNMGDHRVYDATYRRERKNIPVFLNKLDTILQNYQEEEKITTIKIDTQGYEPFILKGAIQTITKNHPTLFLEYWPFGYERAQADEKWMMNFLREEYKKRYFIDTEKERLIPLTSSVLDTFFSPSERKESHCNLVFENP